MKLKKETQPKGWRQFLPDLRFALKSGYPCRKSDEIKIESGDNLLTLAEQYKGNMSTTKWVTIVKAENNIYDDTIVVGKTLLIPDSPKKGQLASDQ